MSQSAENSPPWRITLCITELNVGGAERALVELATRLDRSQFTPAVYSLGPRPATGRETLVERLEAASVPVHFLNARGVTDSFRVVRELRQLWRTQRPQIVQTWLWHANVLGAIAAKQAGVPHVVTGIRVAEPRRRGRYWLERFAGRRADSHVAVSEAVAEFARHKIGLDAEKVVVIPNGVAISQEAVPTPQNRRAIVFMGRLDEQKGVDQLIAHAPQLLRRLPDHNLSLFGAGPLEAAVRDAIAVQGLQQRIHLHGWTDDVVGALAGADVVVVPSRWEGMSNVVLEAMAAGRAIVAFGVEGVSESLGDGAREQAVPPQDWPAFIERTVEFATNESLRRDLGAANRRRAAEFSWPRMVASYERLYDSLIVRSRF